MAHRVDRDREPGRDPGRDLGRDRERDRPARGDRERREPIRDRPREPTGLNEFFVDGEGIHRDVMQREICKYLGPEAYSRPGTYNGTNGYIVTAVRPFTPKMIDDLQMLSDDWVSENRDLSRRGYEGVPYPQSQASRRADRSVDSSLQGVQDTYGIDPRPYVATPYSSASVQPNYTSTTGYQPTPGYPSPQQVSGYPPSSGYAPVPAYPPNNAYPQGTMYPSNSVYPTASGYSAPGFAAPVGRPGNPNDQNYTYDTGDYSNQGYQYRQQGAYPTGAPPRDPRVDPRADPRTAPNYPYVSAPQDVPMRVMPIDERYGPYGQSVPTTAAGRGGFPAPARGPTAGGYEPPPPRDGFDTREPVRDDRRRR